MKLSLCFVTFNVIALVNTCAETCIIGIRPNFSREMSVRFVVLKKRASIGEKQLLNRFPNGKC